MFSRILYDCTLIGVVLACLAIIAVTLVLLFRLYPSRSSTSREPAEEPDGKLQ